QTYPRSHFSFNNSFKYLHRMIQQFYPSVGTALQRVALALVYCDHPALLPVIWNFTLTNDFIKQNSQPTNTVLTTCNQHLCHYPKRPSSLSRFHFLHRSFNLFGCNALTWPTDCISPGQTVFIPSKLFIQKLIKVFLPRPHYPRSISDDSSISIFNTATLSHILILPFYLLCCSEHILTFIFLLNHFSKSPDILTLG